MSTRKGQDALELAALAGYARFIGELKARVLSAHVGAARAVNRRLILLYWDIGRAIVDKQQTAGWGDGVVERIALDLCEAFPDMRGFSSRNVWDMRRFYLAYSEAGFVAHAVDEGAADRKLRTLRQPAAELPSRGKRSADSKSSIEIVRQLVAEIPWGHHLLILNKLTDPAARLYYLRATTQLGWSRNVLLTRSRATLTSERARKRKPTTSKARCPRTLPNKRTKCSRAATTWNSSA